MTKKMLVDARHPEETRVAVLSGGKVEDFDFESLARKPLRGNIYLARVTRVEPSLQAAFVEYGGNRHGFLAFSEIHPDYYHIPVADRDVLRAAEALEAELAAKLAAYDKTRLDDDLDDDDSDDEGGASEATSRDDDDEDDDTAEKAAADESDSSDDADEKPRGRRRRRRRGGKSAAKADNDAKSNGDDDTAASASETSDSDSSEDAPAPAEAAADYAGEQTAEAPDWHGVDDKALAPDTAEKPAEDDTGDAGSDDDDDGGTPPRSMALEDPGDPKLVQDLNDEADNTQSAEDATDDGREALAAIDTEETPSDVAQESEDDAESTAKSTPDEENDDVDADDDDDGEETADESEAREIAELEKRYEEARRARDKLLRNYRIQEVIKRRQIMLVQVVKEERGNKGAALTTFLSLAGRYGVLMPNNARGGGVSRKITNSADRKRLRNAMSELEVPKGQSLIIRTAGAKRTKAEIKRDYDYLARLWDSIRELTMKSVAPALIYEEASLIKRAIRDLYDKDTGEILVEGEEGYREAKDFMKMLMPSHAKNVQPYREAIPLFMKYDVERQLDEMYRPVVTLKSGGYLVIQQTEALISIDVNSGKSTKERNVEATALKTNSEAAVEVARQCRLRDLAGLLVIDFIDMEENRNNRAVEKKFKDALKTDRARIQVGSISNFGLLEMSRQRRRSGIVDGTTRACPTCEGAGAVRSVEMAALRVLRSIEESAVKDRAGTIIAHTAPDVALYVLNQKRSWINRMESSYGVFVEIQSDTDKSGDQFDLEKHGRAPEMDTLRQGALIETAEPVDTDDDVPSVADNDDNEASSDTDDAASEEKPRKRRRRRRGKSSDDADGTDARAADSDDDDSSKDDSDDSDSDEETRSASNDDNENGGDGKKRRRRGRRGGRRNRKRDQQDEAQAQNGEDDGDQDRDTSNADDAEPAPAVAAQSTSEAQAESETTAVENAPAQAKHEEAAAQEVEADVTPVSAEDDVKSIEPAAAMTPADVKPAPAANESGDNESGDDEPSTASTSSARERAIPEDTPSDDNKPKRGGWWQRAFARD